MTKMPSLNEIMGMFQEEPEPRQQSQLNTLLQLLQAEQGQKTQAEGRAFEERKYQEELRRQGVSEKAAEQARLDALQKAKEDFTVKLLTSENFPKTPELTERLVAGMDPEKAQMVREMQAAQLKAAVEKFGPMTRELYLKNRAPGKMREAFEQMKRNVPAYGGSEVFSAQPWQEWNVEAGTAPQPPSGGLQEFAESRERGESPLLKLLSRISGVGRLGAPEGAVVVSTPEEERAAFLRMNPIKGLLGIGQ